MAGGREEEEGGGQHIAAEATNPAANLRLKGTKVGVARAKDGEQQTPSEITVRFWLLSEICRRGPWEGACGRGGCCTHRAICPIHQ